MLLQWQTISTNVIMLTIRIVTHLTTARQTGDVTRSSRSDCLLACYDIFICYWIKIRYPAGWLFCKISYLHLSPCYPHRSPCWSASSVWISIYPFIFRGGGVLNTLRLKGCLKGQMATTPTSHAKQRGRAKWWIGRGPSCQAPKAINKD